MNHEQLTRIIDTVPGFRAKWDSFLLEWQDEDELPWYIGMSELAHYVVDCQSHGTISEFSALFSTIEDLLQNPDPDIEGLITIGLFEDIQSIATHREFGSTPFRLRLGPLSLQRWDQVDEGLKRIIAQQKTQKPKWWQFWRKREGFDVEQALAAVQNPELRKIIETEFRKK